MSSTILLSVTIWYAICLVDLHAHNQRVDKRFADPDPNNLDPEYSRLRRELHVSMYGFYILLAVLIILNIRNLIAGIV